MAREASRTDKRELAKILLVDDDPNLVRALSLRLRANNYAVVSAGDGYAAVSAVQKEHPDLIILDLGLPVGDGFVVLERLHKLGLLSSVPVVVLSARDARTYKDRALTAGATAFFQKPAENNELLGAIWGALNSGS
jgi:DNA-binding response OmpR family regulator